MLPVYKRSQCLGLYTAVFVGSMCPPLVFHYLWWRWVGEKHPRTYLWMNAASHLVGQRGGASGGWHGKSGLGVCFGISSQPGEVQGGQAVCFKEKVAAGNKIIQ